MDVQTAYGKGMEFVGWFYMDGDTEKAFDFANMTIKHNMDVYAKWKSTIPVNYTIYYRYQNDNGELIDIADPVEGQALAGSTRTFTVKTGTELYKDYHEGYFPTNESSSIDLVLTLGENNYTFYYVKQEATTYIVQYRLYDGTLEGQPLTINGQVVQDKVVTNNIKALVTETFEAIPGWRPDAYQKQLVVSANNQAENIIRFYYSEDNINAYYRVTYYVESLHDNEWEVYRSYDRLGEIGGSYRIDEETPISITGFEYNEKLSTTSGSSLSVTGAHLQLYYNRLSYPYKIYYFKDGSTTEVIPTVSKKAKYGQDVYEHAISVDNYTQLDTENNPLHQKMVIQAEADANNLQHNKIVFYYRENKADIRYQIVGPENEDIEIVGQFSESKSTTHSESVFVLNGQALGATAVTLNSDYEFVGWYLDAACTVPINGVTNQLIPNKVDVKQTPENGEDDVYQSATYYAKFDYASTYLTIQKTGDNVKESDIFIFTVTNDKTKESFDVTTMGDEIVTISEVIVGDSYTIAEKINWSWRYASDSNIKEDTKTLKADKTKNTFVFTSVSREEWWLNFMFNAENIFTTI